MQTLSGNKGKLDQYTLEKNAQRLNVVGVNRHTIDNGMDS
jgi:hypothetical protein